MLQEREGFPRITLRIIVWKHLEKSSPNSIFKEPTLEILKAVASSLGNWKLAFKALQQI